MDYVSITEGRALPGLRLVLSAGVPGPWGESAKAVLRARNVPFVAVAQTPMAANDDLRAWTGLRNAPIAVLDDEPPVHGWHEIVMLGERLGSGPSLLPDTPEDRTASQALSHAICGKNGFGWNRRLSILGAGYGVPPAEDVPPFRREMLAGYDLTQETVAAAPGRVAAILRDITDRLHAQRSRGADYLFGHVLSATDLHWACFSQMVAPLPQAVNPMPEYLRPLYATIEPEVADVIDPILIAHRDHIYERHIGLPLDY